VDILPTEWCDLWRDSGRGGLHQYPSVRNLRLGSVHQLQILVTPESFRSHCAHDFQFLLFKLVEILLADLAYRAEGTSAGACEAMSSLPFSSLTAAVPPKNSRFG